MKKILCFFLALCLAGSLLACSGAESAPATTTAETPVLQAGYGRAAFTPKASVKLTNQAQSNFSAVYEDVCITCLALQDAEGDTLLLFSCDMLRCQDNLRTSLLRAASEATGIAPENMVFSVTHNHNGPNPAAVSTELKNAIVEASTAAMADLSSAQLFSGTTYTQSLNFVRHYVKEDGSWFGAAYTSASSAPLERHEDDPDNAMQLLRFDREGKKPILLMNWQAHGVYSYSTDLLTADFIGPVRRNVEQGADCHFVYFQGASGNLAPNSLIQDQNRVETGTIGGMEEFGKLVAQTALDALPTLSATNGEGIDMVSSSYTATVHKDTAEYLDAITKFEATINAGGTVKDAVIASGDLVHSTISLSFPGQRAALGDEVQIPLVAFRLGDLGFISAPYEMFDDSGKFIKENSPFAMTLVIGYTGTHAYIPTRECIEHTCYEWECGYYEVGTAEALADAYVALLKTLPQ